VPSSQVGGVVGSEASLGAVATSRAVDAPAPGRSCLVVAFARGLVRDVQVVVLEEATKESELTSRPERVG